MEIRNKISFSFFIRRTRLLKSGEAPICVKITVGEFKEELSILKSIKPKQWDALRTGTKSNTKEARELNDYLLHVQVRLQEHLNVLREKGKEVTARSIKNAYLGISNDEKTIVELFSEHNRNVRLLADKGEDYSRATAQRYETSLLHIQNFIKLKYKVNDLPLSKINQEFIKGLELYLKTVRNCNHNTTVKYIKNFKKIIYNAFQNGWIKQDPFANVKLRLKKVDKGFLSEEELETIINKKFSVQRLECVRDIFVFGCFTGLAYSDLKNLSPGNLVKGEDGKMWIHTKRIKTGNECHIPLLPAALEILEKYRYIPYCIEKNILLPVYSNQKMNAYLKEIADVCGINKQLTSHIARHTFATTVTLNNDVPIESVSKMLGHSTITMTQNYARLLDKKVSKDMDKLQEKFSLPGIASQFQPCLN